MAETTTISWADATVNFWMGCTAVSPACDGCYARALVQDRFGKAEWGGLGAGAGTRTRTGATSWNLPFKLHRKAEREGTRPFVFVNSLADIFDNQVPAEWRRDAFDVMRRTPRLVYLLLTKRPGNIVQMCDEAGGLPRNAALGTTCEDQPRASRNLSQLEVARLGLLPLFTFGSFEPLLSSVFIDPIFMPGWVITGGETDQGAHRARPTHPDWFRSLRDQCAAAGVPFHHKQNGEWLEVDGPRCRSINQKLSVSPGAIWMHSDGRTEPRFGPTDHFRSPWGTSIMVKAGKARAGRLLDGVLHDARPAVPAMGGANG